MIKRYALAWVPMVFIAIMNAIIRELGYSMFMTELRAHQVSTATGIAFFGLYTWLLGLKWKIQSERQALAIGFIWLVLTIAFEFIFGHYVMGNPWSGLLHDYNLLEGRVWSLLLVSIVILPYVFYKIRS